MNKMLALTTTTLLAALSSCGNLSDASGENSASEIGGSPAPAGMVERDIRLETGGVYTITSMAFGGGFLKLSGDFDVDCEADSFRAYLMLEGDEEIMSFELASELKDGWSKNFKGRMEFSFTLPEDFGQIIKKQVKACWYSYNVLYTDFGLGPVKNWKPELEETGAIASYYKGFWQPLESRFFVGDLENAYNAF